VLVVRGWTVSLYGLFATWLQTEFKLPAAAVAKWRPLLRESSAVRNALLAVAMARHGTPGGETVLEGEAGFYHAYAGNNRGELRYSFTGDNRTDLASITHRLGSDWRFLETLYRIYSTAGYNIAHVELTARLCDEHNRHGRIFDGHFHFETRGHEQGQSHAAL
jgi:2-methylcitrate dehydratase PrpD